MFLETSEGELINTADIVKIKRIGKEGEELSAQAEMRDGGICLLKRSMLDIQHLVTEVIPAATGFYVTDGGEEWLIIAWKRTYYGWEPVTLNGELNETGIIGHSDFYGIVYPNGKVHDTKSCLVFDDTQKWEKHRDDMIKRFGEISKSS